MVNTDLVFRDLISFGELFDGQTKEIRVIYKYGIAGKLWNSGDRIYVTGKSSIECFDGEHYNNQQYEINEVNKNIEQLIELYSD